MLLPARWGLQGNRSACRWSAARHTSWPCAFGYIAGFAVPKCRWVCPPARPLRRSDSSPRQAHSASLSVRPWWILPLCRPPWIILLLRLSARIAYGDNRQAVFGCDWWFCIPRSTAPPDRWTARRACRISCRPFDGRCALPFRQSVSSLFLPADGLLCSQYCKTSVTLLKSLILGTFWPPFRLLFAAVFNGLLAIYILKLLFRSEVFLGNCRQTAKNGQKKGSSFFGKPSKYEGVGASSRKSPSVMNEILICVLATFNTISGNCD